MAQAVGQSFLKNAQYVHGFFPAELRQPLQR
jgi:hypothetical protein